MGYTSTQKTILRSRISRHVDSLIVAEHIQSTYALELKRLNIGQLEEVAARFHVALPSRGAAEVYDKARAAEVARDVAMNRADEFDKSAGLLMANIEPAGRGHTIVGGGGLVDDAETDEQPEAAPVADDIETKADADVFDVLASYRAMDMQGMGAKLKALALRANTPPEVITIAAEPVAPAGARPFARQVGKGSMHEVGIACPVLHARESATALPLYNGDAPAKDMDYSWPDVTAPILAHLARGRNVLLHGPAGVGKTELATQVAAFYGREFVRISCDDQTDAAQLVGMMVPDGDGGARWQDGVLTAAIRRPGTVILVDEPSLARPGALFVFQSVLDGARRLTIADTGEQVPVAPGVLFLLADNTNGRGDQGGQYAGTRVLNLAFLDRCGVSVRLNYLDPDTEARVLVRRTGCTPVLAAQITKFAALTRTKERDGALTNAPSLRRLMALAEAMTDGAGAAMALQLAVLGSAAFEDVDKLKVIWEAEFNAMAAGVSA